MINLFDNYDDASRDFLISQRIAKINIPTVVINDDGFLPDYVDSPLKYFCQLQSNHRPLYFDQVKVPKYWRITGDANGGAVFDLKAKRANIVYASHDNQRLVKEVQWLDENGQISWADHYNNHAVRYGKTYFANGRPAWTNYYNQDGQCVIRQNLIHGDVFLNFAGHQQHFSNVAALTLHYLRLKKFNLDHIFYNTLDKSLAVSLMLPADSGEDICFWHEKLGDQLPGNMQFLLDNDTRTKHIVFQDHEDWNNKQDLIPKDSKIDFQYLGMIYIHPRGNSLRPQALILTNSDQIANLTSLVKLLPKITFNIAAITEMSPKLLAFGDYDNVNLYPTVTRARLTELLKQCDLYFDINHQNEILDAVRGAFEQNMLIVGFKDTLHEPRFINPVNVFEDSDDGVQVMAQKVLSALVKPELMKDLIDGQRIHASDVWPKDYQRVLGDYMDD